MPSVFVVQLGALRLDVLLLDMYTSSRSQNLALIMLERFPAFWGAPGLIVNESLAFRGTC